MTTKLVGRENELNIVRDAVLETGNHLTFLLVSGDAGVGKTALLQHIPNEIGKLPTASFLLGDSIIDFDDAHYKLPDGLSIEIARQLGSDSFKPYLDIVKARRQVEKRGASPARLARLLIDADEMFAECLEKVASQKRVILRFDTFEKIYTQITSGLDSNYSESRHPFFRLLELIQNISNIAFIVAGRNAYLLHHPLLNSIETSRVVPINLQPLNLEESKQILHQRKEPRSVIITPEWESMFHFLSGGYPIILEMALEWVERDSAAAANWLVDQNLRKILYSFVLREQPGAAELVSRQPVDLQWLSENFPLGLQVLQKEFRKEMVSHIAKLKTKEDLLILTLALVNPLDADGIAEILDVGQDTATNLFEQAKKRANVKILPDGRIRLTDGMEELVKEFVWPEVDSEGTRERRDTMRAISYLERRSEKLLKDINKLRNEELASLAESDAFKINEIYNQRLAKEQEFWIIRTESLERRLFVNPTQGVHVFYEDFDLTAQFGYLVAREALIGAIQPHLENMNPGARLQFQRKLAQHLLSSGKYSEASDVYDLIAISVDPRSPEMAEVLVGKASCLMRARGVPGSGPSIRQAISKYWEALRLSETADIAEWGKHRIDEWQSRALLSLGWAHRALGQLSEAQDYYRRCYRTALDASRRDFRALAANGIAYIYALLRDEERARNYSEEAIDTWQGMIIEEPARAEEHRNRLAQAYNTAGEIWVELNQPGQALRFFETAVDMFSQLSIEEWLSRALSGRGWTKWIIGKLRAGLEDTDQSITIDWPASLLDLERAYELSTSLDAPIILHRMAHVLWDLGEQDKAIKTWNESNILARQVGDLFTEYNSLSELLDVALNHPIEGFEGWRDYQKARAEYMARNPDVKYPILDGLFFVYLGNLALVEGDVDEAVKHYQRGLGILSRRGTYLKYNLKGQLKNIQENVIPRIPKETTRYLGQRMIAFWRRPESPEELVAPDAIRFFQSWSNW